MTAVERRIEPGERFLLCTEGLHGAVGEAAIIAAMAADDVADAAQRLADTVLEASGSDNITAILLSTRDEKEA